MLRIDFLLWLLTLESEEMHGECLKRESVRTMHSIIDLWVSWFRRDGGIYGMMEEV